MTAKTGKGRIRKGREAENEVVELLHGFGFTHAERRRLSGNRDLGDIAGIPCVLIDVKDHATLDLAGAMDGIETKVDEAEREGRVIAIAAAIFKRRGRDIGEWYAVVSAETFAWMCAQLAKAEVLPS